MEKKLLKPLEDLSFEKDLQNFTNLKLNHELDFIYDFDLESKVIGYNSYNNKEEDIDKKDIKELLSIINEDKKFNDDLENNIIINIDSQIITKNHKNENDFERKKDEHYNECQEILSILKKPLSNKNIRHKKYNIFKPLNKPKKISLIGRVLSDIPNEDNFNDNSTRGSTQNNGEDIRTVINSEIYNKK